MKKVGFFEGVIGEMIAGVVDTVYGIAGDSLGFKSYDTLIFNNGVDLNGTAPIDDSTWSLCMTWYRIIALVSGGLVIIACVVTAYKFILRWYIYRKKKRSKRQFNENCSRRLLYYICTIIY